MRIGIDISLLGGNLSGIGVFLKDMLYYFNKYDNNNEYFLYSNREIEKSYIYPEKHFINIKISKPHLKWQFIHLPSMLKNDKIDIFWEPNHCIPMMPKGVKYIFTVHDLAAYLFPQYVSTKTSIIHRLFLRRSLVRASMIIAISESTKKEIVRHLNIDDSKIKVIYDGDSKFKEEKVNVFEYAKIKEKYKLNRFFLYVGNVHPRKNISVILDAYKIYCESVPNPFQLVLAGDFLWKTEKINKQITEFPFHNKIIITGFVSDKELFHLYKFAEALVFPSRYEGFGFPLVEAMALGTLVITANSTSLPEVAGNAAFYLNDLDDSKELSNLLKKIHFISKEEKHLYLSRGYEQSKKFNRQTCATEMLHVFNNVYNHGI